MKAGESRWRYGDERLQRIALGGSSTDIDYSDDFLQQLRKEYRQLLPRNPLLHHRRWNEDAQKAWDDGSKTVIALCGEPIEVMVDPRQSAKYAEPKQRSDGYLLPDQLNDTEYEDPQTGLWWLDMDCVDCLRVANENRVKNQRLQLERVLTWCARHPEDIQDSQVDGVLEVLEQFLQRRGTE